jgi:hypothetical protein
MLYRVHRVNSVQLLFIHQALGDVPIIARFGSGAVRKNYSICAVSFSTEIKSGPLKKITVVFLKPPAIKDLY